MLRSNMKFQTGKLSGGLSLTPFEVLELVARRTVFPDIDIEPMAKGWKITCQGKGCSVSASGLTEADVVAKIINQIWIPPGENNEL